MIVAAFLLPFALTAQDPTTHQQALTCSATFQIAAMVMSDVAMSAPTPENEQAVDYFIAMMNVADEDRMITATREGISEAASQEALASWTAAGWEDPTATVRQYASDCVALYQHRLAGQAD